MTSKKQKAPEITIDVPFTLEKLEIVEDVFGMLDKVAYAAGQGALPDEFYKTRNWLSVYKIKIRNIIRASKDKKPGRGK